MINYLTAVEFLERAGVLPVIDVRSEKEYLQGHIPAAINLPLFNNDERAIVGTLYKNSGREASVLKGLELAGPKLADFVKQVHKISGQRKILVHCWRGGLRSESMAWLFQVAGYEVCLFNDRVKGRIRPLPFHVGISAFQPQAHVLGKITLYRKIHPVIRA